ncbi:hypothetical protein PAPYR_9192 [Paratrimastix pyriformis]|uniref:Uncharacterized protein n=1 Tax=Paratrimastix pyriformis TaxID=342808 RepID=A0ABQ8UBH3_9EUKA|nr:hypothetical protein PAPYR_9192 [Paratrimastix pyriformis]
MYAPVSPIGYFALSARQLKQMEWGRVTQMESELDQIEEDFIGGKMRVFGAGTKHILDEINNLHDAQITTSLKHIYNEKFISESSQQPERPTFPTGGGTDPWTRTEAQVNDILDRGLAAAAASSTSGGFGKAPDSEFQKMNKDFRETEASMNEIKSKIKELMGNVSRLNEHIAGLGGPEESPGAMGGGAGGMGVAAPTPVGSSAFPPAGSTPPGATAPGPSQMR